MRTALIAFMLVWMMVPCLLFAADAKRTDADLHFLKYVKPVLDSRCVACHGAAKVEGGLRVDSRQALLDGGDRGAAIVPGEPDQSVLLASVVHASEDLRMPPKDKLSAKEVASIRQWIINDAPWPDAADMAGDESPAEELVSIGDAWSDERNPIVKLFAGDRLDLWSLKPVQMPSIPEAKGNGSSTQELDRLVAARLAEIGLSLSKPADSRTIVRRLYFDLHGLPPTYDAIGDFEQAKQSLGHQVAVAQLIDKLLESPRYGEHLARMWLDAVRYSDSNGFDWDEFRPAAWRFRDYVIRAFNDDKSFDRIIVEQLAGDELLSGSPQTVAEQDALIATGYLRMGPFDNAAGVFDEQDRSRAELLADLTETTASAFLGLTMSCCRCHDHKYDPLSQADHYRLRSFFAAVCFADDVPINLTNEQVVIEKQNAPIEKKLETLQKQLVGIQKRLDKQSEPQEKDKTKKESLERKIELLKSTKKPFDFALLATDDVGNVPVIHVFFQGDPKSQRDAVTPGFPSILNPNPALIAAPAHNRTTGRRLALANWIASPDNPLTARVMVNRLWQQLMGRPLVATPNDFGFGGSKPTDAILLDYLASELMRNGWSIKAMIRLIASSATYQQSLMFDTEHFVCRVPRRLTAEQIRDSLLQVCGQLNNKSAGPPVWPGLPTELLQSNPAFLDDNPEKTKGWYPSPQADQHCRSIFLVQKRNTRIPFLETFDLPENSVPCARRQVSTVAPQALSLLNSELAINAAESLAAMVSESASGEPDREIEMMFSRVLQRMPSDKERAAGRRLIDQRGLVPFCRAMLNTNEFVYVD